MNIKQIAAGILTLFALLGAAWGLNKQFTPREILDLKSAELKHEYTTLISDLQKQMIQIQRNNQISAAQQQVWYWQQEVMKLTRAQHARPADPNIRQYLNEATRNRDHWQRELHKLMNP